MAAAESRWLVLGALMLASRAARAGNDEGIPVGDEAALTGNSVAALVADGSSLFYNPAGLAGVDRDQIDVAATATMLRFYSLPSFLSTTDGGAGDGSFTEFLSVPSALSYVRGIGNDWRIAFGLFVPESSSWTIDVPLQTNGNTFHLSASNRQSLYYGVIGVGYRLNPRLRLGASVSGLYFSRFATLAGWAEWVDPSGSVQTLGLSQEYAADIVGATMAVGVQWELTPRLHLGASIRAPVLSFMTSVRGSVVVGTASTAVPAADVTRIPINDTEPGVHQARALRARLGVARTFGKSWMSVEGDFQPKVTDEELGGRRSATWNVRAGGLVAVSERTSLGFGAFTDRSAEPVPVNAVDTRLDFYGVTSGVKIDNPHELAAGEPSPNVVFSTTVALRYAYGSGEVGGVAFDAAPVAASAGSVRDAPVPASVHELALYLGSTLFF